jgi:hypothetical protein
MEPDKLFPYVVPRTWIEAANPEALVIWPVSHDVYVVLVWDRRGLVQNIRPEDLTSAGLDQDQAFDLAANNLATAFRNGDFQMGIALLADGVQIGCVRGNWMAPAGGLVIGNFHALLCEQFDGSEFVAVAVNQQCLFAFPKNEATLSSFSLRRAIEDEYEGSSKPISRSWLLLDGSWPQAFPGRSSF